MELKEGIQKKGPAGGWGRRANAGGNEVTTQFYQKEVWLSTDDEGLEINGALHDEDCPCADCEEYNKRYLTVGQAPPEYVPTMDDMEPETIAAFKEAWEEVVWPASLTNEELKERIDRLHQEHEAKALRAAMADQFNALAGPLTLVDPPVLPALMVRDDGRTILYEARLNSFFGESGVGKTWLALMAGIAAVRNGGRVLYWDFEDRQGTMASRLEALGAQDLIENDAMRYLNRAFLDDDDNNVMPYAQTWLMGGDRPGLIIIDSCEAADCPSDGGAVKPWFDKHVDPWLFCGAGVLLLDHVVKRREERVRGAIGSTHKLSRIDGAALFVSGQAWTKEQGGKVVLRNHKDRPGDLPATIGKPVATITAKPVNGVLEYTITAPEKEETDSAEVADNLLFEIAKLGSDGVTGSRAVRALVKTSGKAVDAALEELINSGMVGKFKTGRAWVYYATTEGLETAAGGE